MMMTATLRTRSGQYIGSVLDQVTRMHGQIPTTISIPGANPWRSHLMIEKLMNQRRSEMAKGLTRMATITTITVTIGTTMNDIVILRNLTTRAKY